MSTTGFFQSLKPGKFFISLVFMLFLFSSAYSQFHSTPYGLTKNQWRKAQNRWRYTRFNVKLTTIEGKVHEGQMLYAEADALMFWPSTALFLPGQSMNKVIRLNSSEIQSIYVKRKKDVMKGMIYGGMIGGIAGGISMAAGEEDPDWQGVFGILGGMSGGLIGGIAGGIFTFAQGTKETIFIKGKADVFSFAKAKIRNYFIFPDGPPREIQDIPQNAKDEVRLLRTFLAVSPLMTSVFPESLRP